MCIPSPNDLSTKDPLAFQSLSKPVNEFKRGQSVCLVSWGKWPCLICSLTSFNPTEWSRCVPEQPNWDDSAVSCLLRTCMTPSSLTEWPSSAVLRLSKGIALEWMWNRPPWTPRRCWLDQTAFAYLLFGCKTFRCKQEQMKWASGLMNRFERSLAECVRWRVRVHACGFNEAEGSVQWAGGARSVIVLNMLCGTNG